MSKSIVALTSLKEFPKLQLLNKIVHFKSEIPRSIFEVKDSRFDFFELRLALIEDRVFSHTQLYERPKLYD